MPTFAAIDIGSNSVRIKIARLVRHRLVIIHEDREVTRLGKSVFKNGMLTPSAMSHTIETLRRFHKNALKMGAQVVRVVATSALRDARNGRAFLDWVLSATGWKVDVISGLEEARLIHLGLLSSTRMGKAPVLLMDLGGGSCELTITVAGHIRYTVSLPLGAVRLTEEFLKHDPPSSKDMERLRRFVARELDRVTRRITAFRPRVMIATSGTAAALAAVCNNSRKKGSQPQGMVRASEAANIARKLAKLKASQRTTLPGVGPRRAEIVVAGAAVFAQLLEHCRLAGFRYSPLGLRDGLLAQMAADYDERTRSRRQVESDRSDALLAAVKKYHVDLSYSREVTALVLELFKRLQAAHHLPEDYAEWLAAAAMLHEVGIYINRYGWHRHGYYVISKSEIFGYTSYERLLIATIARYLGNSLPAPSDRIMKSLTQSDRALVPKAVLLLRLARALTQSRKRLIKRVDVRVKGDTVHMTIRNRKKSSPDLELWALEKEKAYFRELLGRELAAEVS